jgi:dihydroflavonol-4-reductase
MTSTPRILITGGCGFLGHWLAKSLANREEPLRVLDLRRPDAPVPGADYVQGSVTDADVVRKSLYGIRRVYHAAGIPDLWRRDSTELQRVNAEGTRIVCEAARRADVERLVYTSTLLLEDVLGCNDRPFTGDASTLKSMLRALPGRYCRSKLLAEHAVQSQIEEGLNAVILRPAGLIGPGTRLTPPGRMLLGFLNREYPAYVDAELNLLDVRDAADAHRLAMSDARPGSAHRVDGTRIRLSALLEKLADITGVPMPRRRMPYWCAWLYGATDELLSKLRLKSTASAPLEGVRLSRSSPRRCAGRHGSLPIPGRNFEATLRETIESFIGGRPDRQPIPADHHREPRVEEPLAR